MTRATAEESEIANAGGYFRIIPHNTTTSGINGIQFKMNVRFKSSSSARALSGSALPLFGDVIEITEYTIRQTVNEGMAVYSKCLIERYSGTSAAIAQMLVES